MTTGTFGYLLKHEIDWRIRSKYLSPWALFYIGLAVLLLFAVATVWGNDPGFNPQYFLYLSFGYPFFVFVIMIHQIKREWRNGTIGWWITLPYSRARLLFAKWIAACAKGIALLAVFSVVVVLLTLYDMALYGGGAETLIRFLQTLWVFYCALLGITPLMVSLGLLTAVVGQSKAKPLTPLLWLCFVFAGNAVNWNSIISTDPLSGRYSVAFTDGLKWVVFLSWAAVIPIFLLAVRIVGKHLKF